MRSTECAAKRAICSLLFSLLFSLSILPAFDSAEGASAVYFTTSQGKIQRLDRSGGVTELIVSNLEWPGRLDVAEGLGKIYWIDYAGILRADLDGSNIEVIYPHDGADNISDGRTLLVDEAGGYVFWSSGGRYVCRMGLGGANEQRILDFAAAVFPYGLGISGGWLFTGIHGPGCEDSFIHRSDRNGSNETIIWAAPEDCTMTMYNLAANGGSVYFLDSLGPTIQRIGTGGAGPYQVASLNSIAQYIKHDPDFDKLYFTKEFNIYWMDTNGQNLALLPNPSTPPNSITGIALSEEPVIWLIEPNGGEQLLIGTSIPVRWESAYYAGNVDIEVSRMGPGGPWETIATDSPNDGLEYWTVTGPPSGGCMFRVSGTTTGNPFDWSISPVAIVEPFLQVTSPNGGELWSLSSCEQVISWTVPFGIAAMDIDLSRSGPGGPWENLVTATDNDGEFAWVPEGPPAIDCYVRICDAADGSPCDMSDAAFEIHDAGEWATGQIYWLAPTNGGLFRTDLGSCESVLLSSEVAYGLEVGVDALHGYVYWSDNAPGAHYIIRRMPIEGGASEIVLQDPMHAFEGWPTFILDVGRGWIYWTNHDLDNNNYPLILRAELDGANPIILDMPLIETIDHLTVDPFGESLFWSGWRSYDVDFAEPGDTEIQTLSPPQYSNPVGGLFYDGPRERLLRIEYNEIWAYDLVEDSLATLLVDLQPTQRDIWQLTVDQGSGQLYWSTSHGKIWRTDSDGGNPVAIQWPDQYAWGMDVVIDGYGAVTEAGSDQSVELGSLDLTFDQVSQGGVTSLNLSHDGVPPEGFQLTGSELPTYFDLTTTAEYIGGIEVCIPYSPGFIDGNEEDLRILHYNETNMGWEDVTILPVDTELNRICAYVTSLSPFILVEDGVVGVPDSPTDSFRFALRQAYPNPFNPMTVIEFSLAQASEVELQIYDVSGRLVRSLLSGRQDAGWHRVSWNGRNEQGLQVSSGIYFYRLRTPNFSEGKKLTLIR